MKQPSWMPDEVLERLARHNIVPREDESEDMWRTLAFLDRLPLGNSGPHNHDGRYIKSLNISVDR